MKTLWNIFSGYCVFICVLRALILAGWLEMPLKYRSKPVEEVKAKKRKKARRKEVAPLEQEEDLNPVQANLEFIAYQRDNKGKGLAGKPSKDAEELMRRFENFQHAKTNELFYEDVDLAGRKFEQIWEDTLAHFTAQELYLINSSRGFLSGPQGILVLRIPLWLKAMFNYAETKSSDGRIDYTATDEEVAQMAAGFSLICGLELWRRADPGTGVHIPSNPFDPNDIPSFKRKPTLERLETYLLGPGGIDG